MRIIICNSWRSHTEIITSYLLLITSQKSLEKYIKVNSEEVKSKNPVLLRERDFGSPSFARTNDIYGQKYRRTARLAALRIARISSCADNAFFSTAAAVSAPVSSLRLCIQNAVSIKMKNQKRNHPNGWFLFCERATKRCIIGGKNDQKYA